MPDSLADNHTRVVLEPGYGMSSDYINANYVDVSFYVTFANNIFATE